ncbi:MAG: helix-turn-helix transcriptional regulator [Flavobacteriales bacterium]|nr:helix-turn-helix transcriptional regulator [Flavobacteriales bacterium]
MIKIYYLKNMFSKSCIQLLEVVLSSNQHIIIHKISLGEAILDIDDNPETENKLLKLFKKCGFELVKDSDDKIVERTKQAAIELIFYSYNTNSLIRNSEYISQKLQLPYEKIAKLFKKKTKTTLEKFIIALKIEKAKEMLVSNEFSVSEIAYMLDYSSVHYLSNQFKKTTGITISDFKKNPTKYRVAIEDLID